MLGSVEPQQETALAHQLISVKEVAHRLGGVSLSFVYDEINRGKLVTIKLRKRRLVSVADFDAYIAAGRQGGQSAA